MTLPPLEFHHVGYACRDIRREMTHFSALGYEPEGAEFEDPIQGIRGIFLVGQGPRVELLAALPSSAVLDPYLKSASKLYHFAYQTPDIDVALAYMVSTARARVTRAPVQSVAFNGRRIAFFMQPNMMLTELIESPR